MGAGSFCSFPCVCTHSQKQQREPPRESQTPDEQNSGQLLNTTQIRQLVPHGLSPGVSRELIHIMTLPTRDHVQLYCCIRSICCESHVQDEAKGKVNKRNNKNERNKQLRFRTFCWTRSALCGRGGTHSLGKLSHHFQSVKHTARPLPAPCFVCFRCCTCVARRRSESVLWWELLKLELLLLFLAS